MLACSYCFIAIVVLLVEGGEVQFAKACSITLAT